MNQAWLDARQLVAANWQRTAGVADELVRRSHSNGETIACHIVLTPKDLSRLFADADRHVTPCLPRLSTKSVTVEPRGTDVTEPCQGIELWFNDPTGSKSCWMGGSMGDQATLRPQATP